jgi:hypothetical protein
MIAGHSLFIVTFITCFGYFKTALVPPCLLGHWFPAAEDHYSY